MAVGYFHQDRRHQGESRSGAHKDEIDVLNWSWGGPVRQHATLAVVAQARWTSRTCR